MLILLILMQPLKSAKTPATLYLKHNHVIHGTVTKKINIFLNTFNQKSLHKNETKSKLLLINCTIKCLLVWVIYILEIVPTLILFLIVTTTFDKIFEFLNQKITEEYVA